MVSLPAPPAGHKMSSIRAGENVSSHTCAPVQELLLPIEDPRFLGFRRCDPSSLHMYPERECCGIGQTGERWCALPCTGSLQGPLLWLLVVLCMVLPRLQGAGVLVLLLTTSFALAGGAGGHLACSLNKGDSLHSLHHHHPPHI